MWLSSIGPRMQQVVVSVNIKQHKSFVFWLIAFIRCEEKLQVKHISEAIFPAGICDAAPAVRVQ